MPKVPGLVLCLLLAYAQAAGSSHAHRAHRAASPQGARKLLSATETAAAAAAAVDAAAAAAAAGRALLKAQQQPPAQQQAVAANGGGTAACPLLQAAKAQPSLRLFASLIGRCGLEATLCGTAARAGALLAPTDEAVTAYLSRRKISLGVLASSPPTVRAMLLYHIIPDGKEVRQLQGQSLREGQTATLHTAAASSPSELVARKAGGALAFTDARGRTGKVVQTLHPAGPSGPCLLVVDRVLSHTHNSLGLPGGSSGMGGVKSVEESGAPRMNARSSIAHASGAVGIGRNGAMVPQQLQP